MPALISSAHISATLCNNPNRYQQRRLLTSVEVDAAHQSIARVAHIHDIRREYRPRETRGCAEARTGHRAVDVAVRAGAHTRVGCDHA